MRYPVIVAGGGLAGSAAACVLARAGVPVVVIERETQPVEKICGEFISAEARDYLRHLGLDIAALGGAAISGFRLVRGDRVVSCALPFAGTGLSRRVLDEALLRHAASYGADIRRGQTVSLKRDHDPIVLTSSDGAELRADTLFLATGKHDLRGIRRPVAGAPDLVGFKLHLRLAPAQQAALAGHVEIMLLDRGYAGIQMVEHDMANLCLLVARSRLQEVGGHWDGLIDALRRTQPHLRTRLTGAVALAPKPLSIFRVPYGFVHAARADDPPGIFRLGDQMGVIPSFTGDGMSIALHSAVIAASCHLASVSAAAYHRRIRHDIAGQMGRAGALYRLGSAAALQPILMQLAALWPGSLRAAATATRVPRRAVSRALIAHGSPAFQQFPAHATPARSGH
jgi:flavin-dependent dehydrogenase